MASFKKPSKKKLVKRKRSSLAEELEATAAAAPCTASDGGADHGNRSNKPVAESTAKHVRAQTVTILLLRWLLRVRIVCHVTSACRTYWRVVRDTSAPWLPLSCRACSCCRAAATTRHVTCANCYNFTLALDARCPAALTHAYHAPLRLTAPAGIRLR